MMVFLNATRVLFLLLAAVLGHIDGKPPNIVFIVADDLGWNDVGWHNSEMITPNLDKLATQGVILNSSYVQYVCSPSRGAFMSGYFPIHTGLQHSVIHPAEPYGLPLNFTILPQMLKKVGYKTHAVGKWHLGFCKWEYTPTYRGFNSFYGYYTGAEDYFKHDRNGGYDFRDDKEVAKDASGIYSAELFGERASQIINQHDVTSPLFLYLPFQSVHAPLQVPERYKEMYPHVKNHGRKTFCGMVSAMDEAIGNVTAALKKKGIMDDTLIIFTSDNGGPIPDAANNWPLRGSKHTLWEGGHRAAALVWGQMLSKKSYVNIGMIHAVDWFPTILHVAGLPTVQGIDGMNQWDTISSDADSPRTEFIYNIDDIGRKHAAVRVGDYKLIEGDAGSPDGWYPPPTVLSDISVHKKNDTGYQLFNLKDDPTEHHDLAKTMPDIVQKLKARLDEYRRSQVPAMNPPSDPKSNPKLWGGDWSPGWC